MSLQDNNNATQPIVEKTEFSLSYALVKIEKSDRNGKAADRKIAALLARFNMADQSVSSTDSETDEDSDSDFEELGS